MNTKLFCTLALAALSALSAFAQSKEQREALRQWPFTFRVKLLKEDNKIVKDSETGASTTEKAMHWKADVDLKMTNMPEKIEVKAFYLGSKDGELTLFGSDTKDVTLNEKGHASVLIDSPVFKATKAGKNSANNAFGRGIGVGNGTMSGESKKRKGPMGERLEGAAMQLVVNGTIVKTFVSKPIWQKGTWVENPSADDFNPMVHKK